MVDYRAEAAKIAQKYGLDPDMFVRQIQQESGFDPNAKSSAGALGLAQLMPGTALDMGVLRIDPMQNLEGGAKYMRMLLDRYNGDYRLALAAYNAGMGSVDKAGGIPAFPETQNYVNAIYGQQPVNTQQGGPAVDQYAQAPQSKGILSYITDPEKRAKLGLVLSSLASTPNAGVQQMLTNKIAGFEDARTQNKTAQWLASKGRSDLAEAVAGGMISAKDAVAQAMQAPDQVKGIEVNGKLVDPVTGRVIYDPTNGAAPQLTSEQLSGINTLRDDASNAYSELGQMKDAYGAIQTFYNNPGSVSDKALVVAFAKILDPTSVVREGESAAIANAGSLTEGMRQMLLNTLAGGGNLPPEIRTEILTLSEQLYTSRLPSVEQRIEMLRRTAMAAGFDPTLIFPGALTAPAGVTTTVLPAPGSSPTPAPSGSVPGSVSPYLPPSP
jgi:hypothetical protein